MTVKVQGLIPEVEIELDGDAKERIQMTGRRVATFWIACRRAFGWDKLPFKALTEKIMSIVKAQNEGAETGLEVDEEKLIEAVDLILPDGLRGNLRYPQYHAVFNEAFGITVGEVFAPRDDVKKK